MHLNKIFISMEVEEEEEEVAHLPQTSSEVAQVATTFSKFEELESISDEIRLWLPREKLFQCKVVSKEWLKMITDEFFMRRFEARQDINSSIFLVDLERPEVVTIKFDEEAKYCVEHFKASALKGMKCPSILGSAGGLICIGLGDEHVHQTIVVINPRTRMCRKIVEEESLPGFVVGGSYAFGYEEDKKEHTIVKIYTIIGDGEDKTCVNMFSLGDIKWRVKHFPHFQTQTVLTKAVGSYNEYICWHASEEGKLITFNLKTEALETIELPLNLQDRDVSFSVMHQVVGGKLCEELIICCPREGGTELWRLDMNDNVFKRIRTVMHNGPLEPLCYLLGDEKEIVVKGARSIELYRSDNSIMPIYDASNDKRKKIAAIGFCENSISPGLDPKTEEKLVRRRKSTVHTWKSANGGQTYMLICATEGGGTDFKVSLSIWVRTTTGSDQPYAVTSHVHPKSFN